MAKTFAKFTKVEIVDKNGNEIEITSDGKLKIEDTTFIDVFNEILVQLKIISLKLNPLSEDNPELDSSELDDDNYII